MPLYRGSDEDRELREDDGQEWRGAFACDYARVVHSACFRRLQGKTQVFPGHESDFFRNRLTHSMEVAQIAEGIAERLNHVVPEFAKDPIRTRICASASLIHDLGHPPFGHNGERALDDAMRNHGGFEGNAQTLRIVARNERKVVVDGTSHGLNLAYRTLAAVLKYDRRIPRSRRPEDRLVKGYYLEEAGLVRRIKAAVVGDEGAVGVKTLECAIMDVADDIAYSTFDLEDSFKAGFLSPAAMLSSPRGLLDAVAAKVAEALGREIGPADVLAVFADLFANLQSDAEDDPLTAFANGWRASENLAGSAHLRTAFSSHLVKEAIQGVGCTYDAGRPMLSRVTITPQSRLRIEVLKHYTFHATIVSPRLKIPEYRGYHVVSELFGVLSSRSGVHLLPDDVRAQHAALEGDLDGQMRCVCDFVAGMTDRYAIEFYGRLHSDSAQSMFKPI